ncbi:glycosyltransferase family 4 protein [Georgenia muralis]|uniref:D-inositol 3-phosphate glycosyltransferase n=1 Tax=Georgenia muralis TaxID=154117 RepID=A0A3N4Z3Y6_9MICO|nr:glycosyltransferase family 4 protein [Georgenia muralis]RPF26386.1 glycosyltransferase involved in cell wall biosynthesis [Georgenia muralis]
MRRPRRVALVSSSFAPYVGGVEEHTLHVAQELRSAGHQVAVWTVDRGESLGTRFVDGLEVRYLPCPQPAGSIGAVLRFLGTAPGAALRWLRAWRDLRPEVLHVQCFGPNGLYALALHLVARVPLVVSSHGETFADDHDVFSRSRLLRTGLIRSLRSASAVTGCSRLVVDDLAERFGAWGGVVVPNGVDLDGPGPGPRPGDAPRPAVDQLPTVFAVGRVERAKGFDLLLDAFARLQTPARLVIGGDGSELRALQVGVDARGLRSLVELPGRLNSDEVARQMTSAAVVVVPSRQEAFGIVVLEAWRAGTPLVATSLGGPGDLVEDGVDGLVVDPTDPAALANAIDSVLRDPALGRRLSGRGSERVHAYTWTRTRELYEAIYDRVLAPSRSPRPRPRRSIHWGRRWS